MHYSRACDKQHSARHLLHNASRLLEVRSVGEVECLALADCGDDDSLTSCSNSLHGTGSVQSTSVESLHSGFEARATNVKIDSTHDKFGTECRIRRLEGGRRRAKQNRLKRGAQVLATAAAEWRAICDEDKNGATFRAFLTCGTETLTMATASFVGLTVRDSGQQNENGLTQKNIVSVREAIMQEIRKQSGKRRPGSAEKNRAHPADRRTSSGKEISPSNDKSRTKRSSEAAPEEPAKQESTHTSQEQDSPVREDNSPRGTGSGGGVSAAEDAVSAPTLEEVLEALTGLEQVLERGAVGLVVFVEWWEKADSVAEVALKSTYLTPAKRKTWRK